MEDQNFEEETLTNVEVSNFNAENDSPALTNDERLMRVAEALSNENFSKNSELSVDVGKEQTSPVDLDKEIKNPPKNSEKVSFLSPPSNPSGIEEVTVKNHSASVLDYLFGELKRGYLLENDEQRFAERREKFYTFFKIPKEVEKFITYGLFQCVDAFLFLFTFLPLRFAMSIWFMLSRTVKLIFSCISGKHMPYRTLQPAEICDVLKFLLICAGAFTMTYVDTSMLYHIVKSQSVIKLYIMFNMLEVADKLFSSFGQDILDALYWTATEPRGRKREHLGLIPHVVFSLVYVFIHSLLVLVQATTLNVAINSQNKALLTIMLSNNFVELKKYVFKKFEKNNLFSMSCDDVRERFHFVILLFVVIIQTMKEYNWSYDQIEILFPYCIGVMIAEVFVDWTKHAFITRFNEISHEVYQDYTVSLAYDLASCKLKNAFADHSDLLSRRMGFIPIPLAVLVVRIVSSSIPVEGFWGLLCFFCVYLCLVSGKLAISIFNMGYACEKIEVHRNAQKEKLPQPRQCNSLPSSRHHSVENLTNLNSTKTKSMPQSPAVSTTSSTADITAQAELLQESLTANQLFANSNVSLNSLGIDDSIFGENGERWKNSETFGDVLRNQMSVKRKRRRVSLQEIKS